MIDLNFDTAEAMQAFEDGSEFDVKNPKTPEPEKANDVFAEAVEVVEVVDEAKETE